jgi:hypothetical protein
MSFSEDPNVQKVAEAYALDTCDFVGKHFRIKLDWSDSSIQQIESVLDTFHKQAQKAKPSPEQVMGFAKMFGSYVGEVYRKNHGATWGLVELNGQKFPGLKAQTSGTEFWPWGRVRNRLVNGAEDNVWHYYSELTKSASASQ